MSIKITGHPSLASDLYVKMGQVIQEIDMLSQFVKQEMRKWGIFLEIFQSCVQRGGIIYLTVSGRRQYSRDLPHGGMEIQKKCWKTFVIRG